VTPRELAVAENESALTYCYKDRAKGFPGRWGKAIEQAERHISKLEATHDGLRALDVVDDLRGQLQEARTAVPARRARGRSAPHRSRRCSTRWRDGSHTPLVSNAG